MWFYPLLMYWARAVAVCEFVLWLGRNDESASLSPLNLFMYLGDVVDFAEDGF